MTTITLYEDFSQLHMQAGIEYALEDVNAGQLMQQPGLVAAAQKVSAPPALCTVEKLRGSHVLITRPGGIGDLLFLTPLIEHLATGWDCKVHVSTCASFHPVLAGNPHITALHDYPQPVKYLDLYPAQLWLENAVESGGPAEELHMAELFFHLADIQIPDGFPLHCRMHPQQTPSRSVLIGVDRWLKNPLHLGLHLTASAINRQYNRDTELLDLLLDQTDWILHIFGAPGEVRTKAHPRIHNHTQTGLSLTDTLALLPHLHAFVGVDSGLLHAAGGLDLPCLGLFASFHGELRCKHHPRTHVIQARAHCAPCFYHQRLALLPPHCPGAAQKRCVVLDSISPQRIVEELKILTADATAEFNH